METLYHCQNKEIAYDSDYPEDRFIWATGELEARDKLKASLDQEDMEWDIDEFEIWVIYDEDGNKVERKKK